MQQAGITYSEHAEDGLFGIIVKSDWVVCSEGYINAHAVLLNAAKHGCS